MSEAKILESLNPAQKEAVAAPPSNILVLAGAGSGKTRVLIHRIAWLVRVCDVSPYEILAVTFTNKAAGEMKTRTQDILEYPIKNMWIGTFHSIANRLLRTHSESADLRANFQILDQGEQVRVIRRVMEAKEFPEAQYPPLEVARQINRWKDDGLRASHVSESERSGLQNYLEIYTHYEQHCNEESLVDFAELLLRSHELWLNDKEVLTFYRNRFRHILVDEFQDTNKIQFAWLKMLAGNKNKVFVVGDDDQSIYSWRGAQIANMHNFPRQYKDVQQVSLERNYRSTQTILHAANSVIKNNQSRMGKTLWTESESGDKIRIFAAFDEFEEARFVADQCHIILRNKHFKGDDIAVLYRNNVQSRILEQVFGQMEIPYVIHGGTRFYERAEIRNALSYMRFLVNPDANAAFDRIINTPPRGIGARTLRIIRELAGRHDLSMWQATLRSLKECELNTRATNALRGFISLVTQMQKKCQDVDLQKVATTAVYDSGLFEFHANERGEIGNTRKGNLEEFVLAAAQYQEAFNSVNTADEPEASSDTKLAVHEFLDRAALDAGDNRVSKVDSINMMTLHSAKGLEFPVVFIVGMEEDLFPHSSARKCKEAEEEERRLAYVGITRSMKKLTLTYAHSRSMFNRQTVLQQPSRFIREIPKKYKVELRPKVEEEAPPQEAMMACDVARDTQYHNAAEISVHGVVHHTKFGYGQIISEQGDGESKKWEVRFNNGGTSWFLANTSFLKRVS